MQALIDFFSDVPTWFRSAILIGGIVLFWIAEGILPLFKFQYQKVLVKPIYRKQVFLEFMKLGRL